MNVLAVLLRRVAIEFWLGRRILFVLLVLLRGALEFALEALVIFARGEARFDRSEHFEEFERTTSFVSRDEVETRSRTGSNIFFCRFRSTWEFTIRPAPHFDLPPLCAALGEHRGAAKLRGFKPKGF